MRGTAQGTLKLVISTPAYSALAPEAAHSFAVMSAWLQKHVGELGVDWEWHLETRNPNQALARNCLAHRFLMTGAPQVLLIDADSVFSCQNVFDLLARPENIVGTLCKMKVEDSDWVGSFAPTDEVLAEAERIGFGMVKMTRGAVLRMAEGRPTIVPETGDCAGMEVAEIFRTEVCPQTRRPIGVDYAFSKRWLEMGGRLWIHTGVRIGHVGTHVFR